MNLKWFGAPPLPRRGFALQPRVAALRGYPGEHRQQGATTPTVLHHAPRRRNPVEVERNPSHREPRVGRWRGQPWAVGRNPVGVLIRRLAPVALLTCALSPASLARTADDDSAK